MDAGWVRHQTRWLIAKNLKWRLTLTMWRALSGNGAQRRGGDDDRCESVDKCYFTCMLRATWDSGGAINTCHIRRKAPVSSQKQPCLKTSQCRLKTSNVGVGRSCINPRFYSTSVGWNLGLTYKRPTTAIQRWKFLTLFSYNAPVLKCKIR